jgi:AraC family transcriptional activator of mtrCDE
VHKVAALAPGIVEYQTGVELKIGSRRRPLTEDNSLILLSAVRESRCPLWSAAPLLNALPAMVVMALRDTASLRDTAALIQLWINECATDAPGVDFTIDQLAYVVFVHMLREQIASGVLRGPLSALTDTRLGPVMNQIHVNPGGDHSVNRLASEAGMSRSSFAQHFKEKTDFTPAQYVTHWRMQQATRLLRKGDHSIASIAEQVGYGSEVAFRKAYRGHTGTPPGRVRRGDSIDD